MPVRKFTNTERIGVLQLVVKYDRRGYSQEVIGQMLVRHGHRAVTKMTISNMLREIRAGYRKAVVEDAKEAVREKLEQYRAVREEAWEAWEASSQGRSKKVTERAAAWKKEQDDDAAKPRKGRKSDAADEMRVIRETLTEETTLPGAQYLGLVLQTYEAERKLLALDPVDDSGKATPNQTVVNIDIGALLAGVERQRSGLIIDAKPPETNDESND